MSITAVSLFSGCGGFDLGARNIGVEIMWANEINPVAAATYKKYLPEVTLIPGDIREIEKKKMPQADLLIGCYPCQGYSAAALRRSNGKPRNLLENKENYLYLEFIKAIRYVKPKFVFIENVGGLQSSAEGLFFKAQKKLLNEVGYGYKVFAEKLNAKDYGLPQNRERVFIVGVSKALDYEYTFPQPTHGPKCSYPYKTQEEVIRHLPLWPDGEYEKNKFHGHYLTRNRKRPWDSYSYTIVAHSHHVTLHPMGEPMRNIGKDEWELQGADNRRLSWRECALLQSFDENFEPEGTLSAKYTQIGNAVPPRMSEIIVSPVVRFLEGNR